ncbi:MAG: c-type cytochrome [Bacteroidales bacterium]
MNLRRPFATDIMSFVFIAGYAQGTWVVPAADKAKKNPVAASAESVSKGKNLYNTHCKSCHGDPGKNNGLPLNPKPTDPASEQYQKNTDGEIFYKITNGRGAMPSFKATLPEQDRWHIINFVRSLSKKKVAEAGSEPASQADTSQAPTLASVAVDTAADTAAVEGKVMLALGFDDATKTIYARAFRLVKGKREPAQGIPVEIAVKRYFRDFRLSEAGAISDANGYISAVFPEDLPADTAGKVIIVARIPESEQEEFGQAEVQATQEWGVKLIMHNIKDARSLWNDNWKLPLWLLFSYLAAVLGVLTTFGYILLQVGKIYKIGKNALKA